MAYTIVWNAATPVGSSTNANTIDSELQNLKTSIQERMNNILENTWETDGNDPKTLAVSAIAGTPSVAVIYGSNQTIVDTETLTVAWDQTATLDTGSFHDKDSNNSRLTITTAAYYRLSAQISIVAGSAAIDVALALHKNGSNIRSNLHPFIASDAGVMFVNEIVLAAANDYYEIKITQSSGQNMTLTGGANGSSFQIERINGTT